jgi:hypothetical protein
MTGLAVARRLALSWLASLSLGGSRLVTGEMPQSLRSLSWLASLRSAARAL